MAEIVWIHSELLQQESEGKSLEEIGQLFTDAMLAAQQGRVEDFPDWMAESVDMGGIPE